MLVGRINNANNTLRPATTPPSHLSPSPLAKLAPFRVRPRYSGLITRLLEHLEYLSGTNGPGPESKQHQQRMSDVFKSTYFDELNVAVDNQGNLYTDATNLNDI